jgi:transposase, IS30 family
MQGGFAGWAQHLTDWVCAMTRGVAVPWEVRRGFWAGLRSGLSVWEAAEAIGVSPPNGRRWLVEAGGVIPYVEEPTGLRLCLEERVQIATMVAAEASMRAIAVTLDRNVSTISRELAANGGRENYRPLRAQLRAERQARRPQASKLAKNDALRERVEVDLQALYSPEQIAGRLRVDFPDDPEMQVHHETIYRELFVQARGTLRADLLRCLRTQRARRMPRRKPGDRFHPSQIRDKVMISDRPTEVDDRVVPGHWEGDLIVGKDNKSAIGTLVERTTNYTLLLHLPDGHGAEQVTTAITEAMAELPKTLRRSLTWDQGRELHDHKTIAKATELAVYFCDPHSPWQRGVNENTNGLLRQYFPKGTDLSAHSSHDLAWVAQQLNNRPRKRLGYARPEELINKLMLH